VALVDLFHIKKQYDIKLLLDDVDFHLDTGERVTIIGQNGCGKSTLMKIVTGEEEPTEGKRVIDQSVQIGMLDQHPHFDAALNVRQAIENELSELQEAKKAYEMLSQQLAENFDDKAVSGAVSLWPLSSSKSRISCCWMNRPTISMSIW